MLEMIPTTNDALVDVFFIATLAVLLLLNPAPFAGRTPPGGMSMGLIFRPIDSIARRHHYKRFRMETMLEDNLTLDRLDQLLRRENLRLAWRIRFADLFSNRLIPTQHAQLHAEDHLVFDSPLQEKAAKE